MSRHIFVIPMVFSMSPLHTLGNSDQNEVKHDVFIHVMPLVTALLHVMQTASSMASFSSLGEGN